MFNYQQKVEFIVWTAYLFAAESVSAHVGCVFMLWKYNENLRRDGHCRSAGGLRSHSPLRRQNRLSVLFSIRSAAAWRYDCIRSAPKPQGYEVERIFLSRIRQTSFDISQYGTRVAQIDMYPVAGARTISITLISGAKQVNAAVDSIIQPCLER